MRTPLVAAALIALVASCSSPAPAPTQQTARFTVRDGERVDGPERLDVRPGDTVRIEVTSDVDDELHVHGYDRSAELTAGKPGEVSFTADATGDFEVELHHSGAAVTTLRVSG
jgi:plastocyanin